MNDDRSGISGDKSTDQLRAEIAATRAQVAEDVEAIGQKLSPENLKHEAKETIRRSVRQRTAAVRYGVTSASNSMVDSARANPIPVALIGLGLGWLVWDARRRSSRANVLPQPQYGYDEYGVGNFAEDYGSGYYGQGYGQGYDQTAGVYGATDYVAEGAPHEPGRVERVREGARHLADQARGRVQDARGKMQDYGARARDQVGVMRQSARERAMHVGEVSRQRAMWARNQARNVWDDNPFTVGAVALAAGVGVGLLLPHTEREDRLMGERRDALLRQAKERALEAKDLATETARRAAEAAKQTAKETAKSEVQRRGIASSDVGGAQETSSATSSADVTVREVKSVGETWGQNGRSY